MTKKVEDSIKSRQKFDHILLNFCNCVYNQDYIEKLRVASYHSPKKGDFSLAKNYRGITLTAS